MHLLLLFAFSSFYLKLCVISRFAPFKNLQNQKCGYDFNEVYAGLCICMRQVIITLSICWICPQSLRDWILHTELDFWRFLTRIFTIANLVFSVNTGTKSQVFAVWDYTIASSTTCKLAFFWLHMTSIRIESKRTNQTGSINPPKSNWADFFYFHANIYRDAIDSFDPDN